MLRHAERLFPAKTAVVDGTERWTYHELGTRVRRLSQALLTLGIKKGDRLAVLMLNSHRYLELYGACLELGVLIVPLNVRLAPDEFSYIINDAEASALVTDSTLLPVVQSIQDDLKSVRAYIYADRGQEQIGMYSYEQLIAESDELDAPPPVFEEDVAGLFYTSGTTSHPKGVMLTNRNLYINALQMFVGHMPTEKTVFLHSAPMFHIAGGITSWQNFWVGATHVVQRRFDPQSTFALIEQERVTRVVWVPTMISMLLAQPNAKQVDFSSLQTVIYAGSPIAPATLQEALEVFGCEFIQAYGMTEASPVLTNLIPEDHQVNHLLLSCGREVPGVLVRVVNSKGEEVAPGEVGEIIACGANIMAGYWRKPQETSEVLRDGWYFTGDMGTFDEHNYLYIVDRKKDMIISGGENITSIEVEKSLTNHAAVAESAVIGVPDERWGEVVKAFVVLHPGAQVSENELIAHCRKHLAAFKCPHSVEFVETLPKNATGKVLKRDLREPYWQGQSRRVH
ncbi:MAG: fatty acid--CoA ligase [Ktedonobacteraceae bacterium]|nr:fatty acid--CoA ligase [Ktedonobacteraceae bacterium]